MEADAPLAEVNAPLAQAGAGPSGHDGHLDLSAPPSAEEAAMLAEGSSAAEEQRERLHTAEAAVENE